MVQQFVTVYSLFRPCTPPRQLFGRSAGLVCPLVYRLGREVLFSNSLPHFLLFTRSLIEIVSASAGPLPFRVVGLMAQSESLFADNVSFLDGVASPTTSLEPLRLVRRRARASIAGGSGRRPAIDALRYSLPQIWRLLAEVERRRIMRRLLPFWDVRRFRVAPRAFGSRTGDRRRSKGCRKSRRRHDRRRRETHSSPRFADPAAFERR
jgi:hypothetical protein